MIRLALALTLLPALAHAADQSFQVSGRDVVAHVPPDLHGRAPLVLMVHCLGCDAEWMFDHWGARAFSDTHNLVLVAPRGSINRRQQRYFNANPACCDFGHTGVDDVGFMREVIRDAQKRFPIDARRIYIMGYSNGGFMAHRMVCEFPALFAGAASAAGGGMPICNAKAPVTLVEIHGDVDLAVPISGGQLGQGLERVSEFPPLRTTMEEWAKRDGCSTKTKREAPIDLAGGHTTVERWPACKSGAVELWTVGGVDHQLTLDGKVFEKIWDFWTRHPRN